MFEKCVGGFWSLFEGFATIKTWKKSQKKSRHVRWVLEKKLKKWVWQPLYTHRAQKKRCGCSERGRPTFPLQVKEGSKTSMFIKYLRNSFLFIGADARAGNGPSPAIIPPEPLIASYVWGTKITRDQTDVLLAKAKSVNKRETRRLYTASTWNH